MKSKTETATSWEHRGVTITFDSHATRPEFRADAPGKSLRAPSMDAIKKKIDLLSLDTFEGFYAYVEFGGYGDPPKAKGVEIVEKFKNYNAVKHGRCSYLLKVWIAALDRSEGVVQFLPSATARITRSGANTFDHVLPWTDAVRQLWLAERRALFAEDEASERLGAVHLAARESLDGTRIMARDYRPHTKPAVKP